MDSGQVTPTLGTKNNTGRMPTPSTFVPQSIYEGLHVLDVLDVLV